MTIARRRLRERSQPIKNDSSTPGASHIKRPALGISRTGAAQAKLGRDTDIEDLIDRNLQARNQMVGLRSQRDDRQKFCVLGVRHTLGARGRGVRVDAVTARVGN